MALLLARLTNLDLLPPWVETECFEESNDNCPKKSSPVLFEYLQGVHLEDLRKQVYATM